MENIDNILNTLIAKLFKEGNAEFSQNGLKIKTSYNDGCLSMTASYSSPEKDDIVEKITEDFKNYINSLSDEFFLEIAESFENNQINSLQKNLDSKDLTKVTASISEFMTRAKEIAKNKIQKINSDIEKCEKEKANLVEIRESYIHVLNKKI